MFLVTSRPLITNEVWNWYRLMNSGGFIQFVYYLRPPTPLQALTDNELTRKSTPLIYIIEFAKRVRSITRTRLCMRENSRIKKLLFWGYSRDKACLERRSSTEMNHDKYQQTSTEVTLLFSLDWNWNTILNADDGRGLKYAMWYKQKIFKGTFSN